MSQRGSGYERKERDLYETPAWVTEALLPHICNRVDAPIWEPAVGGRKMMDALAAIGFPVHGTDIADGCDFLKQSKSTFDYDFIITNPPYDLAREFIEHALKMTADRGLVAMLLRTDYDHAATRQHLFSGCAQFAKKLVLTKRIVWFGNYIHDSLDTGAGVIYILVISK